MSQRSVESLLAELNPEQASAVQTVQGPLLVLAGAGTGKTKVITTRIAYMLDQRIPPESIVAVSFTNKAAREMRERLAHFVGKEMATRVELSTFHSFSLKLLREFARELGLPRRFAIADENQARAVLRETLRELNLQELMPLSVAAGRISYFKDQLLLPEDFSKQKNIFNASVARELFERYNRRLRLYGVVDFDDIVYLAALGLKNNPEILRRARERYHYLMVDEYQDTNNAQFELIRLLAGERRNVCVVGDDDQSIYSWRGAKGDVLFLFLETFPGARRVSLEQNYRCSPRILDAANTVIAENQKRLSKKLWSRQANVHPIRLHACENERDEAMFVADTIPQVLADHPGMTHDNIAILVRASEQTVALEQVFAERGIPYFMHGGTRFVDRQEVRILFSYLKFASNPDDLNSLFTIINVPARGVGTAALERIRDAFQARKGTEGALHEVMDAIAPTHKGMASFWQKWKAVEPEISSATDLESLTQALRKACDTVGLKEDILAQAKNTQEVISREELLNRVLDVVGRLELREFSLPAVIDVLHLDDPAPREKAKDSTGKVQIMTIHASKGLEFFAVFLVGVEDGIMPHERSIDDSVGGVDEERRLFYVAITRAKQRLFISHCGFRSKGRTGHRERERLPSRFLKAIPKELLEETETSEDAEQAKVMAAKKRLFELFR